MPNFSEERLQPIDSRLEANNYSRFAWFLHRNKATFILLIMLIIIGIVSYYLVSSLQTSDCTNNLSYPIMLASIDLFLLLIVGYAIWPHVCLLNPRENESSKFIGTRALSKPISQISYTTVAATQGTQKLKEELDLQALKTKIVNQQTNALPDVPEISETPTITSDTAKVIDTEPGIFDALSEGFQSILDKLRSSPKEDQQSLLGPSRQTITTPMMMSAYGQNVKSI